MVEKDPLQVLRDELAGLPPRHHYRIGLERAIFAIEDANRLPTTLITVAGLRAALARMPDDAIVVLAADVEGYGYSPLDSLQEHRYIARNAYAGEIGDGPKGVPAVVLGPVN